jgi:hypothetical protein
MNYTQRSNFKTDRVSTIYIPFFSSTCGLRSHLPGEKLHFSMAYAAARRWTLKISSSVKGSIADSGTVITAMVSPSTLNISSE